MQGILHVVYLLDRELLDCSNVGSLEQIHTGTSKCANAVRIRVVSYHWCKTESYQPLKAPKIFIHLFLEVIREEISCFTQKRAIT